MQDWEGEKLLTQFSILHNRNHREKEKTRAGGEKEIQGNTFWHLHRMGV